MDDIDIKYMHAALIQAEKAEAIGEVPIGCVIVYQGKIIARGHNLRKTRELTADHAEMVAIAKANKKIGSWRLEGCTIYVTLEPCPMCAGAILQARMDRVVFGARDQKAGALGSVFSMYDIQGFNHYPLVTGGVLTQECGTILTKFFKNMRAGQQNN